MAVIDAKLRSVDIALDERPFHIEKHVRVPVQRCAGVRAAVAISNQTPFMAEQKTGDITPITLQVEFEAAAGRELRNAADFPHAADSSRLNHMGRVNTLSAVLRVTAMA